MAKAAGIPTNWNIIIPAIILMVGTAINGVTAVYMARVQAETTTTLKETKKTVEQTHDAVNSTASRLAAVAEAAAAENKRLREDILRLSQEKATLVERAADRVKTK